MRNKGIELLLVYLLFVVCIAFLDIAAFGGILQSGYIFNGIVIISTCVYFKKKGIAKIGEPEYENKKLCMQLLIGVIAIVVVATLPKIKLFYVLILWLYFFTVVKGFLRNCGINESLRKRIVYIMRYCGIAAVVFLYCVINQIPTKWQAEADLEKEGYTKLEWISACSADAASSHFLYYIKPEERELTYKERKIDYYVFYGEKDGAKYGLVYSAGEHRLFGRDLINEKEELDGKYGTYFELI